MHLFDELLEHLLGDSEVGNHAVFHRSNGSNVAGRFTQHLLGFLADGLNGFLGVGAAFLAYRDDRGFVQNDALAADIDQGIRGAKIDRKIVREVTAEKSEHACRVLTVPCRA